MFNLSGSEMIFLLLIALVVLGPEKLPEAVRKFGKAYGEFKKMTTGFQSELRSALDEPMKEMRETADQLRKSANLDFNFEPDRVDGDTGHPAAATTPVETTADDVQAPVAAVDTVAMDAVAADAATTDAPAPVDVSAFGLGSPAAASAPEASPSDADAPDTASPHAPVDLSAFGLGSSAPAPADADISDVRTSDVINTSAIDVAPAADAAPATAAPTPNGWSPVTPRPSAPTPTGWSPVSSNGAVGATSDEVAPG